MGKNGPKGLTRPSVMVSYCNRNASTDVHGLIKRVQSALRDVLTHAPSAASPASSPSIAPTTAPSTPPMGARLDVTTADPVELAQQLTLIDQEKFAAIQPVEFVRRLWVSASERTSHVSACIDWFNHLSFYVATQVCFCEDGGQGKAEKEESG